MKRKPLSKEIHKYWRLAAGRDDTRIYLGRDEEDKPLRLRPEHLKTHLMIQGPTGVGKTFLARHIFRSLAQQNVSIFVDDPKAELFGALEEDCAALGLDNRTLLFHAGRGCRLPAFNPLKRNGLEIEDHSLWTLAGIRAAWAQETFDQTPQMARWLYNAISLTIEGQGTFLDALDCLHFEQTAARTALMSHTKNRILRQEWEGYESLPMTRRREETAPAYARLHRFCNSPMIRTIISRRAQSLDLGEVLQEGKILLTCFERYRPMELELVNLLRSLLLQSLLAQAFYHPLTERPPVYIILDEAEHALERDTGIIETILNEGRSLGIHLILIFQTFAQVAKKNPGILASVLSNCRTKIIGGHIIQDDLKVLSEELFTTEWNPYIVKDEIEALELNPVETTRVQKSYSEGGHQSAGQQSGTAYGTAVTRGMSVQRGSTRGRSTTSSYGASSSQGRARSYGQSRSEGETAGENSRGETSSGAAFANTSSSTEGDTHGLSESWNNATSVLDHVTRAIATSFSRTESISESEGVSFTKGTSWQEGSTVVPFYEYERRMRVTSRQFLTLQEFLAEKLNKLKSQPTGHWAISPPEGKTIFFRAARVRPLLKRGSQLTDFREKVFNNAAYIDAEGQGEVENPAGAEAEEQVEYNEADFAE
jgi:hypothetical protein